MLSTLFVEHLRVILTDLGASNAGRRVVLEERVMEIYTDPVMHKTAVAVINDVCERFTTRLAKPRPTHTRRTVRRLERVFAKVAADDGKVADDAKVADNDKAGDKVADDAKVGEKVADDAKVGDEVGDGEEVTMDIDSTTADEGSSITEDAGEGSIITDDAASIDIEHTDDEPDEDSEDDSEGSLRDFIVEPTPPRRISMGRADEMLDLMYGKDRPFIVSGSPDMIHVGKAR